MVVFCKANHHNISIKDFLVETVNSYGDPTGLDGGAAEAGCHQAVTIGDFIFIKCEHNIVRNGEPIETCFYTEGVCKLSRH